MSALLQQIAAEVKTNERTLRRAINEGTLRAVRPSAQTLRMDPVERRYVRTHWLVIGELRRALRTEPNVESAVLFGSTARGEDTAASDIDVLVWFRAPSVRARRQLRERLQQRLDRPVQVIEFSGAGRDSPLLKAVLRDGRVLVDRTGNWPKLRSESEAVRRRALRERHVRAKNAQQAREFFAARTDGR